MVMRQMDMIEPELPLAGGSGQGAASQPAAPVRQASRQLHAPADFALVAPAAPAAKLETQQEPPALLVAMEGAAGPATWTPPRGKHACGRDPKAGPGTCMKWWEGCPNAEKRGCYIAWAKKQKAAMAAKQETR